MKSKIKLGFIIILVFFLLFIMAGKLIERQQQGSLSDNQEIPIDFQEYKAVKDIISIEILKLDEAASAYCSSYKIRYQSDDCEVIGYISIPNCCKKGERYPCLIFNRGGNRDYKALSDAETAWFCREFGEQGMEGMIVLASQYRGTAGGTGQDQFGGADINDVLKLLELCEDFDFVDMKRIYMMGISRGGMMTYMAARGNDRISRLVVVSGIADVFMEYEDREDMKQICRELIGGTPTTAQEKYVERSAVRWADEIYAPILMLHSIYDVQVSCQQSENMAAALDKAGKDYSLIKYNDSIHGLHQEDIAVIADWLKKE